MTLKDVHQVFYLKKDTGMVIEKQFGDVCDSWTQTTLTMNSFETIYKHEEWEKKNLNKTKPTIPEMKAVLEIKNCLRKWFISRTFLFMNQTEIPNRTIKY